MARFQKFKVKVERSRLDTAEVEVRAADFKDVTERALTLAYGERLLWSGETTNIRAVAVKVVP